MSTLSRRNLLKASAGAAVIAVPMAALSQTQAGATSSRASQWRAAQSVTDPDAGTTADEWSDAATGADGVMFFVLDAAAGEVAILQGSHEVVVRDRQLVGKIMATANATKGW